MIGAKIRRVTILVIAVFAMLAQSLERAKADDVFEFVKFMCRADLNYVEIEPMIIWNARDNLALTDPDLVAVFDRNRESGQGVLVRECRLWPSFVISLHSNWRRPPTAQGMGGGAWNEEFELRLNDRRLAVFVAGEWSVPFHLIVSGGLLTVCRMSAQQLREYEMNCKVMGLVQWLAAPEVFK